MTGKPKGYSTVSPYLLTGGEGPRVIDFLKDAFGAEELRRYDAGDGKIIHAEVRVEDSVVMLGDAPAKPASLHVYVADVDAIYLRALAAGGVSAQEPTTRENDPDRRAGVVDPAGNTWWIASEID